MGIILMLAGSVAILGFMIWVGGHDGRVRLYTRLISEAQCGNCGEPFGHATAVISIHEEDHATDGRQEDSSFAAAKLIGTPPAGAHVSSFYPIVCSSCGRRSVFRVADHAVLLKPEPDGEALADQS